MSRVMLGQGPVHSRKKGTPIQGAPRGLLRELPASTVVEREVEAASNRIGSRGEGAPSLVVRPRAARGGEDAEEKDRRGQRFVDIAREESLVHRST